MTDNQYRFILTLFQQFIAGDRVLAKQLRENSRFQVDNRAWHFTLPDLFAFCQQQNPAYAGLSYMQFRHMLFNSPINHLLKEQAAEIAISKNEFNVDQSTYVLRFCTGDRPVAPSSVKLPTNL